MNGPQHYAKAQELIESANYARLEEGDGDLAAYTLAVANVHATLALTAAVMSRGGSALPHSWSAVI